MSEAIAAAPRRIAAWRAARTLGARRAEARIDHWLMLWCSLIAVVMTLYVLIGSQPYQHEAILDPVTGVAPISPINRYIWLGLLAASAPVLYLRRDRLLALVRAVWPLLALYGWFVLTVAWSIDPGASQRRLFLYIVELAVILALRLGFDEGWKLQRAVAVACGAVVAIDLASWAAAPGVSMTELGLAAIHTHKNTLGAAMLLSLLILGPYALHRESRGGKLAWGALFVGGFLLLVASRSKTSLAIALVAIAMTPGVMILLRLRRLGLWAAGLAALAAVGAALFGWWAWCLLVGADPLWPLAEVTFTQRTDVWRFSLGEWAKRPIQGVGFGAFWDVDPAVQPSLQTDLWFAKPDAYTNESHNGYIDLLVTTGIAGFAGAMALWARWTFGGLAALRETLTPGGPPRGFALTAGLFPLVFFIHNWMESTYFTANTIFGLFILIVGVFIDTRPRGASA